MILFLRLKFKRLNENREKFSILKKLVCKNLSIDKEVKNMVEFPIFSPERRISVVHLK